MNSLPKDVGAAGGGGYDPNDPNIKRVRQLLYLPLGFPSLCRNARVADFASLTLDQRHDGVVFRQDHDVGSNGFRCPTIHHTTSRAPRAAPKELASLPLRQQLATGFKDMGTRSYGMAKNFGKVGAMFAGIECGIEGFRAKNDLANGVAAGCLTGGILARGGGPMAVGGGCAAFAAFSAAIDAYMRSPGEE
ncbi:hypothetical protein G7054_g11514 [Neopestalotiopsis clavispora]|nr:hypothetical protein G7054_g11514 [Neopestalotiopsis clavispora]